MKKIILLFLCIFVCNISIDAKTIVNYKNKSNSSPIKKYILKLSSFPNNIIKFSIKGKLVDGTGSPIKYKTIQVFFVSNSFYRYGNTGLDTIKTWQVTTDSNGLFSKTFHDSINSDGKLINDGEIHFVFDSSWDEEYDTQIRKYKKYNKYYMYEQSFKNMISKYKKYKLIGNQYSKGQDLYSVPNPVRIIYKYPFNGFTKVIPYDKNDNAQWIKTEESKSDVIVLDTIDLSAQYFIEKQNIIDEATKMLHKECMNYSTNDVIKLVTENGITKNNWKEIIETKIKEVNDEREQEAMKAQKERQEREEKIERWKNSGDLYIVEKGPVICLNCYGIGTLSLIKKAGDDNHSWQQMYCPQCSYYHEELNGF